MADVVDVEEQDAITANYPNLFPSRAAYAAQPPPLGAPSDPLLVPFRSSYSLFRSLVSSLTVVTLSGSSCTPPTCLLNISINSASQKWRRLG